MEAHEAIDGVVFAIAIKTDGVFRGICAHRTGTGTPTATSSRSWVSAWFRTFFESVLLGYCPFVSDVCIRVEFPIDVIVGWRCR